MSEALAPGTSPGGGEPTQQQPNGRPLPPGLTAEEWAAHVARVKDARGKFALAFSSFEERTRRKHEEIALEEEQSEWRIGPMPG
jgi:hypothetical protein